MEYTGYIVVPLLVIIVRQSPIKPALLLTIQEAKTIQFLTIAFRLVSIWVIAAAEVKRTRDIAASWYQQGKAGHGTTRYVMAKASFSRF